MIAVDRKHDRFTATNPVTTKSKPVMLERSALRKLTCQIKAEIHQFLRISMYFSWTNWTPWKDHSDAVPGDTSDAVPGDTAIEAASPSTQRISQACCMWNSVD